MTDDLTLATPVALITGAARRIGASIATHLHQSGYRVAIHCHHSYAAAEVLCEQLNQDGLNRAQVFVADLTQKTEVMALVSETLHWAKRLDVLVNNASLFLQTTVGALDDAQWLALFTTNVQAPFWLSLAARSALAEQCGVIINITDIHAEKPLKGYAEYCQTKAALQMQTKVLADEFAPQVRVNAVAPGAIAWPEQTNALTSEQQRHIIEKTLLKQHGSPDYIAQAVRSLIENPFITGQVLRVDGGRVL